MSTDDDDAWDDELGEGAPGEDMERCPNCHDWIYEDAVRCPQCGHYLTESERQQTANPWWFVATVILCLLLVLSWAVSFF